MSSRPNGTVLEWTKLAEKSLEQGDYGTAATQLKRVAHYFRLNKDMDRFREYMQATGDCYFHAARELWNSGNHREASLLYIKASECYREIGDHVSVENCGFAVRKYYAMIFKDGAADFQGSLLDLKHIGDYFRGEDDVEKARQCYQTAARKAEEEGNLILAGGLYRDAGDCSSFLKDIEEAADSYGKAGDNYFKSEKYFEAAWHYNVSGFLFISLERFDEALLMAGRAIIACSAGNIFILLDRLSRVCELLSRRNYYAAEEEWLKIRMKFKRSFMHLVDSCFQKARKGKTQT